ncbi:MAG: MmgE/PrpD family protein [Chloroflexota bacterium]
MATSISETLARWAVDQQQITLASDTAKQAKMALLDFFGVTLGGANIPSAQVIRAMALAQGGAPEATLLGFHHRVPGLSAARANGTAGHALDMDDGHKLAAGHPGVTVIPAALAAAEIMDASGSELLTAIAVGYEVFVRIASAMNPSHLDRGFHTTGTIGPLGAAAAAGLLLGLNQRQLTHALGAAASSASGLFQVLHEGAMFKPVHAGRAAEAGLFAAIWAMHGGEAPRFALDGQDGLLRAYAERVDPALITADLAEPQAILGMYVKLHSACRHVHAAVDAGLELFHHRGLNPDAVCAIEVDTYEVADRMTGHKGDVRDIPTARFSLPFCLALAAFRGAAGPIEFVDSTLNDDQLHSFTRKVTVREDPALTALYPHERGARLMVHMDNGDTETICVMFPRGEPENPATDAEYHAKFRANAADFIDEDSSEQVIAAVEQLESHPLCDTLRLMSVKEAQTDLVVTVGH